MTDTCSEDIGGLRVDRPGLHDGLREAEERAFAELTVVREALADAVTMVATGNAEIGEQVSWEAHDLQRRYHDVHERLVALIARQARSPVTSAWRLRYCTSTTGSSA